ncbi:MAG: STAS domain-containing protein [Chloroflexales bacterium]|nr:STAS domain-containing protein [Chloroflexales bacterium]
MTSANTPNVSLFSVLQEQKDGTVPVFQASQGMLIDISRTLEDCILEDRLSSIITIGIQDRDYWSTEPERYEQLADIAAQICVFTDDDTSRLAERHTVLSLADDTALRQEWFIVILGQKFSAVLCGRDNQHSIIQNTYGNFETILSFQPDIVKRALASVLPIVEHKHPDQAAKLREAATQFSATASDNLYLTRIITRIIGHLQGRYKQLNDLLRETNYLREQQMRLETVVSELAVPVVPLLDGVIVLPLVGTIDTRRAQQVMESLLTGIAEQQADVAIIDITGVSVVDTAVANYVIQSIRAASLLGAHVILTGIGARIAQTLVTLGVDFSVVTTLSNLRDGIESAIAMRGLQLVPITNHKKETSNVTAGSVLKIDEG